MTEQKKKGRIRRFFAGLGEVIAEVAIFKFLEDLFD